MTIDLSEQHPGLQCRGLRSRWKPLRWNGVGESFEDGDPALSDDPTHAAISSPMPYQDGSIVYEVFRTGSRTSSDDPPELSNGDQLETNS